MSTEQKKEKWILLNITIILLIAGPTLQSSLKESISILVFSTIPTILKFLIPLTLLSLTNYLVFSKMKTISNKQKLLFSTTITILLGFIMVINELIQSKNAGCYGKKVSSEEYKDMLLNNQGFTSFGGFANENSRQSWRCFNAPHPKYGISGLIGKGYTSQAKVLEGKKSLIKRFLNIFKFKKNYGDQKTVHYEGIHASSITPPSRWSLTSLIGSNEVKGGIHGAGGFFFNFKDWEMCKNSEGLLINLHRTLISGISKVVFEMPDRLLRDEGIREVIENMGIRDKVQVLDMRGGEILHRILGGKKVKRNLDIDNQLFVSDVPFLGALIHHEVIQHNFKEGKNVLWLLADEDTLDKFQLKKLQILSYRILNDPVLFPEEKDNLWLIFKPFRFAYRTLLTFLKWTNPFQFLTSEKKKEGTSYNPHPIYETEYEKYKNREINKIKGKKKWWQFWKKEKQSTIEEEGSPLYQSNYRETQKQIEYRNKALTIIISTNSNKVLDNLSKDPIFSDSFKFISCYERRSSKITKFYQEKLVEMKKNVLENVVVDRLDVEKEVDHLIDILGVDLNSLKNLVWAKEDFSQGTEINKDIMEKLKITKISFLPQRTASFILAYLNPFIRKLEKLKTNNIEIFRMLSLIAERMAPKDVEQKNVWLEMNDVWEILDIGIGMTERELDIEEKEGVITRFNLKILEMAFEQNWLIRNNEKVRFKEDCIFWLFSSGVME